MLNSPVTSSRVFCCLKYRDRKCWQGKKKCSFRGVKIFALNIPYECNLVGIFV